MRAVLYRGAGAGSSGLRRRTVIYFVRRYHVGQGYRSPNDQSATAMPYRQTERVIRRLSARREAILAAACAALAEQGIQIIPVAQRAGIAAGTVYRYFPSKADL